jgi:hypothetical protein
VQQKYQRAFAGLRDVHAQAASLDVPVGNSGNAADRRCHAGRITETLSHRDRSLPY